MMTIRAVPTTIAHRFRPAGLWLALTLAFAALYGGLSLQKAFSSEYVIQDDARVYLIWMQRFVDADLFPNDLMANYFQSVTPWGLGAFYQVMVTLGMTPLVVSKLLPLPLSLLVGWYGYRLTVQLFPISIAGFLAMSSCCKAAGSETTLPLHHPDRFGNYADRISLLSSAKGLDSVSDYSGDHGHFLSVVRRLNRVIFGIAMAVVCGECYPKRSRYHS